MGRWDDWLAAEAAAREAAGLTRTLVPLEESTATGRAGRAADVLDLAGNDYLGLSRHPAVIAAARDASGRWGAGARASRLVTGTTTLHARLEDRLAEFLGVEAALVMSTGYHANLSIVTALGGRDAVVVSDAHVHASLIDAARLSRARVEVTPHHDVAAIHDQLADAGAARCLVLVESVYSVLGDQAPLAALTDAVAEHDALLVVDEAHGIGVVGPGGRGLVAASGLAGHPHIAVTATLSKSLGSQGGAVVGSRALVDHLINRARPFIYDTGLAPAATGAALAALGQLAAEPRLPDVIHRRVDALAARLGVARSSGAVLSVPMPSAAVGVAARDACAAGGVLVGCFRPPSVPDGVTRLRITCSAGLSETDWERACEVIVQVVSEIA